MPNRNTDALGGDGFFDVSFVSVMCRRLDISSLSLAKSLIFDFLEDSAESGHISIATKVSQGLPLQSTHIRKDDRNNISASMPASIIIKTLSYHSLVKRIDGDGKLRSGSVRLVMVHISNCNIAYKGFRNCMLQRWVSLVSLSHLIREGLEAA
jgi:hypothetical protein